MGETATTEAGLPVMMVVIRTRLTDNTHGALVVCHAWLRMLHLCYLTFGPQKLMSRKTQSHQL